MVLEILVAAHYLCLPVQIYLDGELTAMARVTVEDCIEKVQNRFDLVLIAASRARQIMAGAEITVSEDRDKNSVIALREIAEETVTVDVLRDNVIQSMQHYVEVDEPEEDDMEAQMLSHQFADNIEESEVLVADPSPSEGVGGEISSQDGDAA